MNATRHSTGSTDQNAAALIKQMQSDRADVRLFATHRDEKGGYDNDGDGPSVNLPLVSALVHDGKRWVVYDGNLLNAARGPRRAEVREMLDVAINTGGVLFGLYPVNFTSNMPPDEAAQYLSAIETLPLNPDSRLTYAKLLTLAEPEKI